MLNAPVLQLDAARMHEIDPRNVESLFGMWTVFSKCANTISDGKRLENLSWRVWARETLCCPPQPEKTIIPSIDVSKHHSNSPVPSLSNSVCSDESDQESVTLDSPSTRRRTYSEDSALSISRGTEAHLTPHTLEKIVVHIKEKSKLEPLSPAIEAVVKAKMQPEMPALSQQTSRLSESSDQKPAEYSADSSCISTATAETRSTERQTEHRNSDTSVSSDGLIRSGSVVHGFSPIQSASFRSRSLLQHGVPSAASKNAEKRLAPQKPGGMFTLGGSSEDDESSFEQHMSFKRHLHEPRKSSLSQTISKEAVPQKKVASFRDIVEQRHRESKCSDNDEGAIASSDEEDDDIDDSAIEDDDEAEWEDSPSDEDKPLTRNDFKRIDSKVNLTSRRSILTAGLTEGDRAKGMLNAATQSTTGLRRTMRATSHHTPLMPSSPEANEEDTGIMMQAPKGSRPMPIIATTSNTYAMAHSPRTTRRNMLATELTESLRKNLLWERQQKSTTYNAFLKRSAKSMANLQKSGPAVNVAPHRALLKEQPNHSSYNDYFNVNNEYHTKGW